MIHHYLGGEKTKQNQKNRYFEQKSMMKDNVLNKTNCKHKLNKNFREIAKGKTRKKPHKQQNQGLNLLQHTFIQSAINLQTDHREKALSLDSTKVVNLLERSKIYI